MKNLVEINPGAINGDETLEELMEKAFTAHLSREIKERVFDFYADEMRYILDSYIDFEMLLTSISHVLRFNKNKKLPFPTIEKVLRAFSLFKKWIEEDYAIFLVYSGALTPAGFGTSCLIPLIERGIIDCVTTTGANIYHEIQRVIGGKFYEYDLKREYYAVAEDDIVLADEKFSRIYNIIFPEKDLRVTDDFIVNDILPLLNGDWSFTGYIETVAEVLRRREVSLRRFSDNWIVSAKENSIPIFCGAPQDSSLFFPMAFYELIEKKVFDFDAKRDVNEMAALQYYAQKKGKFAVIILGGGVPKNFTLQGEPYLKDICGLQDTRGFDGDFQISMADVRDGGLSSCPASEGHTWGKVSDEGVEDSLYISGEVLSIFPLLVYEICRQNLIKKPKRLLIEKYNALDDLKKAVKHRKRPMTIEENE